MAAGSHIGFDVGNVRPQRSAIVVISSALKFGLDPIYRFGDIAIFIFCRFGLKLPVHAHFWGFWGIVPPNIVTHRSNPKRPSFDV